ncbi:MAG: LemA family protein [Thermoguttaceae bacterium]|nr:LemA family protein [Thermoguttaceae bacterium]
MLEIVATVLSLTLGTYCYVSFLKNERLRRRYEDMPTSKTIAVFIGDVELKGKAVLSVPLTAPLSQRPAVWYTWSVEEEWQRTEIVPVTKTDDKGKTYTVMEEQTRSGWTPIGGGTLWRRFFLKDDTGAVRIDPENAKVEPILTVYKDCGPSDPFYYQNAPRTAIADSTGRRRFSESIVPIDADLFISGRSRVRDDAVAAEVAWDKESPDYLISVNPEEKITASVRSAAIGSCVFFVLIACFVFYAFWREIPMAFWGLAAGLGSLLPGWVWIVHQSMVKLKNRAKQARSNVDVELQRRYALINPLVEAVKGIRDHEAETQKKIAELRAQLSVRKVSDAKEEGVLLPVAKQVIAVLEAYPVLKSQALFSNLQKNLIETEDRIALARQYYNDTVEYVNSRRESFPEGIVAKLSGVKRQDYFHAEAFERPPVQIEI